MAEIEVMPEVVDRKPAVRKVIDGALHVDGIRVEPWQLTEEELMEFFPERYREEYGGIEAPCPYPGCQKQVNDADKRTYMTHVRAAHETFYDKHRAELLACPDAVATDAYIRKVTSNV